MAMVAGGALGCIGGLCWLIVPYVSGRRAKKQSSSHDKFSAYSDYYNR